MYRLAIGVARFALSAWVGAAVLFVVTGIREVRSPLLDSYIRNVLVGVRFPSYYLFGFILVGMGAFAALTAAYLTPVKRGRQFVLAFFAGLALVVMAVDYFAIYLPLLDMVTPPDKSRPAEFLTLHTVSKWVNLFSVSLCAIVALILCGQQTQNPPTV